MVSTFTTNKGLEQPAHGDYSGNWDVPLNTDMGWIDTAFGGATSLNATAGSATLTVTQYRSLIFNITGTIGSNVTYTIPSGVGGSWIVNNQSSGAYVFFVSASGGLSLLVPNGAVTVIYCDGVGNGMKAVGVSSNGSGASGTWNINISGNAATATTATTAGYATDAGNVVGGYVSSLTAGSGISLSSSQGAVTISGSSVTSVATGLGLTGGPITSTGTISIITDYLAVGTYTATPVSVSGYTTTGPLTLGNTYSASSLNLPNGTWRVMGQSGYFYDGYLDTSYFYYLAIRLS